MQLIEWLGLIYCFEENVNANSMMDGGLKELNSTFGIVEGNQIRTKE